MVEQVEELDYIPDEEKTMAARRVSRLSRRVENTRHRVFVADLWWRHGYIELACLILIVSLNLYLILPLVGSASTNNTFSGPIIPSLAQVVAFISQIPFAYAVQMVNIFFFLLFPVTFYILVKFLTSRLLTAIVSVLITTLPLTLFAQSRIWGGFYSNDSPHLASLGLTPLALYCLISFLRRGGMKNLITSSLLCFAIVLISPFGFTTYLLLAVLATFPEAGQEYSL